MHHTFYNYFVLTAQNQKHGIKCVFYSSPFHSDTINSTFFQEANLIFIVFFWFSDV